MSVKLIMVVFSEKIKEYIHKFCKIDTKTGYYYKGKVLSIGEDYLVIYDIRDRKVMILLSEIIKIEEIKDGT